MNKPSDFLTHPYDSVFSNSERETVARNIMVILTRLGDVFSEVSEDEYVSQRKKDGSFSQKEISYFHEVKKYCTSSEMAKKFSPAWR